MLTFYSNGVTRLESGGWRTKTTAERLSYGPFRVFQRDGRWYVCPEIDGAFDWNLDYYYGDGMKFAADGSLLDYGSFADWQAAA